MKPIKCIICYTLKLGYYYNTSVICPHCRKLTERLIKNNFTCLEIYIIMMFKKHRKSFSHNIYY